LNSVQLKIAEAKQQQDVGRGVARIDKKIMTALSVDIGNYIEIIGLNKKNTAVQVLPGYPEDKRQALIRIDGFIRKNINGNLGEIVEVKKAEVKDAVLCKIAPVDIRIVVDAEFTRFVKDRLIDRPATIGDTILIMMLGHSVPFQVMETNPEGHIIISKDTEIKIQGEPVQNVIQPPSPKNLQTAIPTQNTIRLAIVKDKESFKIFEGEELYHTSTLIEIKDNMEIPVGLALWFKKAVSVGAG